MSVWDKLLLQLTPERPTDAMGACAALCLLLAQPLQTPVPSGLATKLLALCRLKDEPGLQRNALAALSAGIEVDDLFAAEAKQGRAAAQLVELLIAASEADAEDAGLLGNAVTTLGTLAECGPSGLTSVLDEGGMEAIVALCSAQRPGAVQEAAADALCKCMGRGRAGKDAADLKGAVVALAALLGPDAGDDEVRVRALLGLGMLIGGHPGRQLQLASAPGAVGALLALMRQGDDGDLQRIAATLFRELGKSGDEGVRGAVAAGIKAAQDDAEAAARYIR